MAKAKNWIRPDLHSVTPRLVLKDAQKSVEFYEKALGAKRRFLAMDPSGSRVMHGEIQIGNSVLFVCDEAPDAGVISPESAGYPGASYAIAVPNVDEVFERAVDAGCTVKMPLADQFWGDRFGCVVDPFGNTWELSTHIEDLTTEEINERMKHASAHISHTKS